MKKKELHLKVMKQVREIINKISKLVSKVTFDTLEHKQIQPQQKKVQLQVKN